MLSLSGRDRVASKFKPLPTVRCSFQRWQWRNKETSLSRPFGDYAGKLLFRGVEAANVAVGQPQSTYTR